MAHIPYGYRIENGRAVICPEEADRYRIFIRKYLEGLSVRHAVQAAQLFCSLDRAIRMLEKQLYAGDGYYPAIIPQETLEQVRAEHQKRSHPGCRKPEEAFPAQRRFILCLTAARPPQNAFRIFEEAYKSIIPSPDGRETQSPADQARLLRWQSESDSASAE